MSGWWRVWNALAGRYGTELHVHRWVEASRKFNWAPDRMKMTANSISADLVREIGFGVTVVELRCEECGDVKAVRYAGDAGGCP